MASSRKFPLCLIRGYSCEEAAKSLNILAPMLGRWVREYQADDEGHAFHGNGILTPEQAEIRPLKEENKRLKMEKEILKSDVSIR